MDEPMEEQANQDINSMSSQSSRSYAASIAMLGLSMEDYSQNFWPKLQEAIDKLLRLSPNEYIPISYEQMYSCVYKCVCKQHSEKLYQDLLNYVTDYLDTLSIELQCFTGAAYASNFHTALTQYLHALGCIVPIFNYMNRFYVEMKLNTTLDAELRRVFVERVSDKHITKLLPLLVEATTTPFFLSPPVMSSLIKNLYSLKPEYKNLHPLLFAKFIPNILPPVSELDVEQCQAEVRQMQRDLLTHPDFISGNTNRKRPGDQLNPDLRPVDFHATSS